MTLADLLAAVAPSLGMEGAERVPIGRVCIDSRQAEAGDLFVALKGERTDGHAFVGAAFAAGAHVALVGRPVTDAAVVDTVGGSWPADLAKPIQVVVPDPLLALQQVARARRLSRPDVQVIAVTGSVGKTTTKESIAHVLAQGYSTLKSRGNRNNEIGLPLTLTRLTDDHTHVVLEMGMYDLGEIAQLCEISLPRVGVVTNVRPVHLEKLGTIERIAQAKAELVRALPRDGIAFLNGDDPLVRQMGKVSQAQVANFGLHSDNVLRAESIRSEGLAGIRFTVRVERQGGIGLAATRRTLRLPCLGEHAVYAALPAIGIGLIAGLSWAQIQEGLVAQDHGLRLVPKQGAQGITLLDDTYNASPSATVAALNVLAGLPGRHVAVLGDMLELGAFEQDGHVQVGRHCAQTVDLLIAVGQRARLIAGSAQEAGMSGPAVHSVADSEAATDLLARELQGGDVVLVKGSRSMHMEEIIEAFEE